MDPLNTPPKKTKSSCLKSFLIINFGIGIVAVLIAGFYSFHQSNQYMAERKRQQKKEQRLQNKLTRLYGKKVLTSYYIFNGNNATATIKVIGDERIPFSISPRPRKSGYKSPIKNRSFTIPPMDDVSLSISLRKYSNFKLEVLCKNKKQTFVCPLKGLYLLNLSYKPRLRWKTISYSSTGKSPFPSFKFGKSKPKNVATSPGFYKISDRPFAGLYAFDETPPQKIKSYRPTTIVPVVGGIKISTY